MPYSLLINDKDVHSHDLLIPTLKGEFQHTICDSAHQAFEHLRSGHHELAILGSDLKDMSGLAFLRILRDMDFAKNLAVIFLPDKKTEESMAEAFELGVDDYLPKPYDHRELLMRILTVLRRKHKIVESFGNDLAIAGIRIIPNQRKCVVDGERIKLRPLEFALLEILMRKSGRVLTRPYLLTTIWDMSASADTRAVDAMVSRLRRSLGKRAGKLIETVSKMGYCFRDPETD